MAAENFRRCIEWVLAHEGGFSNNPKDPGGPTNFGVTQRTYDAYTGGGKDVRGITPEEVLDIYRRQYWDAIKGDDLPGGVDYAVFDFAVNSGPARAVRFLQGIIGVSADGIVGVNTLAAARRNDAASVAARLCDDRLEWMKRLKTWPTFGRGWAARVKAVRDRAVTMSDGGAEPLSPGKATGPISTKTAVKESAMKTETITAAAGAATGILGSLKGIDGALGIALAIVVGVAGVAAVLVIARRHWKDSDE